MASQNTLSVSSSSVGGEAVEQTLYTTALDTSQTFFTTCSAGSTVSMERTCHPSTTLDLSKLTTTPAKVAQNAGFLAGKVVAFDCQDLIGNTSTPRLMSGG